MGKFCRNLLNGDLRRRGVYPSTRLIIVALAACCCAGCGHFTLYQGDTRISAWTFLDSKSQLSRLSMSDTNRARISIGQLSQESSGTNVNGIIEAAVSAAVRAALSK